jgi:uncharacterized protein (TIGR00725 family)
LSPGDPVSVAVLGSARLAEDDPGWADAVEVGRLLASRGASVLTGGYGGLMAAVSRGAHEAGGVVVGLAMTAWSHLAPNAWNTELRWAADYPSRLAELLGCDAVIALRGGVGTLSELAVAWAAAQTEAVAPALIALGEDWRAVLDALARHLVVSTDDLALVRIVATPAEAVELALSSAQPARRPMARG